MNEASPRFPTICPTHNAPHARTSAVAGGIIRHLSAASLWRFSAFGKLPRLGLIMPRKPTLLHITNAWVHAPYYRFKYLKKSMFPVEMSR